MKLFQLNFFGILVFVLVLTLIIGLPSFVIQIIWNSISISNIERDLSINIFQAALLWGAVLSLLYLTGVFRFSLGFKSIEAINLDSIDDPELREEIEKLKSLRTQKPIKEISATKKPKTDNRDTKQ